MPYSQPKQQQTVKGQVHCITSLSPPPNPLWHLLPRMVAKNEHDRNVVSAMLPSVVLFSNTHLPKCYPRTLAIIGTKIEHVGNMIWWGWHHERGLCHQFSTSQITFSLCSHNLVWYKLEAYPLRPSLHNSFLATIPHLAKHPRKELKIKMISRRLTQSAQLLYLGYSTQLLCTINLRDGSLLDCSEWGCCTTNHNVMMSLWCILEYFLPR